MRPTVIFILVPLLIIGIFFLIPEVWRRLAQRSEPRHKHVEQRLAGTAESLREAAARLRPYRELQADRFRQPYQSARDSLQRAVDHYRQISDGLSSIPSVTVPQGLFAFPHFLTQPQDLVRIPRATIGLWRLERQLASLQQELAEAEAHIVRSEEAPQALSAAASSLTQQRLGALEEELAQQQAAGAKPLQSLAEGLDRLQEEATALSGRLAADSPPALGELDELAETLAQLEARTGELEEELATIRRQRRRVESHLEQVATARQAALAAAADDQAVRDGLDPLLSYADALVDRVRTLQKEGQFDQAQSQAQEAGEVLAVARDLAQAAVQVRDLLDIAETSLQEEAIDVLGRRLHTAYRAAYALADADGTRTVGAVTPATPEKAPGGADSESEAPGDEPVLADGQSRREALEGLALRISRLAAEAGELQEAHRASVARLEQDAEEEVEELTRSWRQLQATMSVAPDDPVARRYRELLQQHAHAEGNPLRLQAFVSEAEAANADLATAASAIRRGLQRVEALRDDLPRLLETAESEAENWRCLQPYLQEMREATATIWQIEAADAQVAEVRATLAELDVLEEQARAAYAALSGERQRLTVLERRISQAWDALAEEPPVSRHISLPQLQRQIDEQVADARSADSVEAARMALLDALESIQQGGAGQEHG